MANEGHAQGTRDPPASSCRWQKVTVKTVPGQDNVPGATKPSTPTLGPEASLTNETTVDTDSSQQLAQMTHTCPSTSDDYAPLPDLKAHMCASGSMADLEKFKTAELLMTLGLMDAAKEWHLKGSKCKGKTLWHNADTMLTDIEKLKHVPLFMMD
ncbi:hypothetical protein FRC07_003457 [Ceratobasidium sp. 392]|nr:hypothetical protein FRC07_003457 [Ceratobasidium sp. 392]